MSHIISNRLIKTAFTLVCTVQDADKSIEVNRPWEWKSVWNTKTHKAPSINALVSDVTVVLNDKV